MTSPIIYNFKEFHYDLIHPNRETFNNPEKNKGGMKICFIGKPGTGKTSSLVELLYWKQDIFPVGQVYSPTEEESQKNEFAQIFPDIFIFGDLNIEAVESFWKRQVYAKKYIDDPRCIMITDDCMTDPKQFKLPIIHHSFIIFSYISSNLFGHEPIPEIDS